MLLSEKINQVCQLLLCILMTTFSSFQWTVPLCFEHLKSQKHSSYKVADHSKYKSTILSEADKITGSSAFDCFLLPSSLWNPPTVPLSTLIKDEWSRRPEYTGRVTDRSLMHSYLRDCRMAFMKHVFPKFRKPVAPTAIPSWQDKMQKHVIIHVVCRYLYTVPLSHMEHRGYKSLALALSFISLLSGERLSWSFRFLCLSLSSAKLWETNRKKNIISLRCEARLKCIYTSIHAQIKHQIKCITTPKSQT